MKRYFKIWKQTLNFKGRSQRKDFWLFILINLIPMGILAGIDQTTGFIINPSGKPNDGVGGLTFIFMCIVILPTVAVCIRRLHDTGRKGWWIFIFLVPLIGFFWLPIMLAMDGEIGKNEYGDDPKGRQKTVANESSRAKGTEYGGEGLRPNDTLIKPAPPSKSIYWIATACLAIGVVMVIGFVIITQTHLADYKKEDKSVLRGENTTIITNVDLNDLNLEYINKRMAESEKLYHRNVDDYVFLAVVGGIFITAWLVLFIKYYEQKYKYKRAISV